MARMTPVEAAKELGIRPQQVYGFIKHNRVHTFSNPNGKASLVDLDEVKSVAGGVKHHRPKDPTTGKPVKRSTGVERGTLLSYHAESKVSKRRRPHRVAVVTEVVKGDEGEESIVATRRGDDSMTLYWEAESLADKIARGQCQIESPESLLSVVMYHWVHTEKPELAVALQKFIEDNELQVPILEEKESPAA